MTDTKIVELSNDIEELNTLLKQAQRKKVQDIISLEIRKLETECVNLKTSLEAAAKSELKNNASAGASSNAEKRRYQFKLNGYGWDQSDKYVKVFVTLKDVQKLPKDQVYCKLTEKSMELHVVDLDNKDYILSINKLLEPINVAESHWKQKTDMVVVFLAKSQPNSKWQFMTEVEKKADDQKNNRFKPELDNSKDPQDSIMGLMKNMYETGDDDMKRMIAKAWYEGQNKKKSDTVDEFGL